MARQPRLMPADPRLIRAEVVRTERTSPSFQRVTIAGPELSELEVVGFDQWFRLFVPTTLGAEVPLPGVTGRSWWKPYLAIPDEVRPHCSNYTIAEVRTGRRGVELDIDVVLHWNDRDEIAGGVAIWATSTRAGERMALLDQGRIFDPPRDATEIHLVADESGLPAVRGILRDLDPDTIGSAIIEVPRREDTEALFAPRGVAITWLSRDETPGSPGSAALQELRSRPAPRPGAYAFVVGESTLATEGRRYLHRAGLAKSRITFSGFWKHEKQPAVMA